MNQFIEIDTAAGPAHASADPADWAASMGDTMTARVGARELLDLADMHELATALYLLAQRFRLGAMPQSAEVGQLQARLSVIRGGLS